MSVKDPIAQRLLAPLAPEQQRLIDLLADSFIEDDFEWPFFQYVEWMLDHEGLEAWSVLQSFPQVGRWNYGPISWVRSAPGMKPREDTEVCLTLVGMAHSPQLREHLDVAFALLDFMAAQRKNSRANRRAITDVVVTSGEFHAHWVRSRHLDLPPRLTYQLLEREPGGSFGARSLQPDTGEWSRSVQRDHLDSSEITTIEDYVARLDRWLIAPEPPTTISAPRISLLAAIDYLDDVWRIAFGKRIFVHHGGERTASLNEDANSCDEFDARLSVLCDRLRTAAKLSGAAATHKKKRNEVLEPILILLKDRLDPSAWPRVEDALAILEATTAMRDSRQHVGASHRALDAAATLGLPHVIVDWASAWQTVSARTVDALGTIRDELRATTD